MSLNFLVFDNFGIVSRIEIVVRPKFQKSSIRGFKKSEKVKIKGKKLSKRAL